MLLKALYTTILFLLVALLTREIYRIWFSEQVVVGAFDFFENGAQEKDKGISAALAIVDHHRRLRQRFAAAASEESIEEKTWAPHAPAIESSDSVLSDLQLNITIKDVNVTDIFSRLRSYVTSPREIRGTIMARNQKYRLTLSVPDAAQQHTFYVSDKTTLDEATHEAACILIWYQASKSNSDIRDLGKDEFCHWTAAWSRYLELREKYRSLDGLADADSAVLKNLRDSVSKWIDAGITYPKYYSLRANISELFSEEKRGDFAKEIQQDRLHYALMLKSDAPSVQTETAREREIATYHVLASARPAILLGEKGELIEPSPEWAKLLRGKETIIGNVAASVGWGRITGAALHPSSGWFAGFAVRENIILTVNFALPDGIKDGETLAAQDLEGRFHFSSPAGAAQASEGLEIVRAIAFEPYVDNAKFALLEVAGHALDEHPPLEIARQSRQDNLKLGDHVAVVSYPARGHRLPHEFVNALLGDRAGQMHLMPGRIVEFLRQDDRGPRQIRTDISTTAGTSGGPLIHLDTGEVVGVHEGGKWRSANDGKFAWSIELVDKWIEEALDSPSN